jgi:serine phosphatase RsbU (regulator of sigma subunit)
MSMLGISFLNEIVRKKDVIKASDVLDQLRISIIEALKQKGESGEQKDGMDIVFCMLNTQTNILQYSGANNPLLIVSRDKTLTEIPADKQPVAIYENMSPFTNHVINIQKGDMLYLMSDGYEDQFGGTKNKKFMAKNLKELLVKIAGESLEEQKKRLNITFENWKGENEQIDDVTILGLKI